MSQAKERCSRCGSEKDPASLFTVDNSRICQTCLYGGHEPFQIYPIGFVSNSLARKDRGFGVHGNRGRSSIVLFDSQKPFMYRIEEEERLTVVYYLHEARPVRSVFHRGLDGKEVGVFASRTPDRLSRIAIQDVNLLEVEGTTLVVDGLDAVNGSPVLDIKMCWRNNR